jgi:hypothetical protein
LEAQIKASLEALQSIQAQIQGERRNSVCKSDTTQSSDNHQPSPNESSKNQVEEQIKNLKQES